MEGFIFVYNPEISPSNAQEAAWVLVRFISEHYIFVDPVTYSGAALPIRSVENLTTTGDDESESYDEIAEQLRSHLIYPNLN